MSDMLDAVGVAYEIYPPATVDTVALLVHRMATTGHGPIMTGRGSGVLMDAMRRAGVAFDQGTVWLGSDVDLMGHESEMFPHIPLSVALGSPYVISALAEYGRGLAVIDELADVLDFPRTEEVYDDGGLDGDNGITDPMARMGIWDPQRYTDPVRRWGLVNGETDDPDGTAR